MLEVENARHLERIFYACIECGRSDWARVVHQMLKTHSADTPKAYRQEAILLFSEGKPQEAYQRLYSILKVAPNDCQTWRTLISLKRVLN